MKELMEFLSNRPQTWSERHQQLKSEDRVGIRGTGRFPRLNTILQAVQEPIFWEARKIVNVPLAISEEHYPDRPDYVYQYWTADCRDSSEFYQVYWHLDGAPWHECDAWCANHQLPAFVAREWRI